MNPRQVVDGRRQGDSDLILNFNTEKYRNILENNLQEILNDLPLNRIMFLYFQHDGTPAHNAAIIRTVVAASSQTT